MKKLIFILCHCMLFMGSDCDDTTAMSYKVDKKMSGKKFRSTMLNGYKKYKRRRSNSQTKYIFKFDEKFKKFRMKKY